VLGLCQRPDVLTSSSAVKLGESGTQPLGALSISARRPIRARSSSRKRVQSARNSSLTKSPGRSGPRAGGGWGCSVGPEITPHLGVERWISRDCRVCRRLSPGSCQPATSRATLRGWTRREAPRKGGMPREIGAKSGNLIHERGEGRILRAGRRAERLGRFPSSRPEAQARAPDVQPSRWLKRTHRVQIGDLVALSPRVLRTPAR
jgi:hypothetical protein